MMKAFISDSTVNVSQLQLIEISKPAIQASELMVQI
jgi:hypothetical protein